MLRAGPEKRMEYELLREFDVGFGRREKPTLGPIPNRLGAGPPSPSWITCEPSVAPTTTGRLAPSPEARGRCVRGPRLAAQWGSVTIETTVWIVSYLFAALGLVTAAYSENPLVWLAPLALASTIFIFFRQGFHFRDGLLVLGRDRLSTGARGDRS
jgi:hypothetical protein